MPNDKAEKENLGKRFEHPKHKFIKSINWSNSKHFISERGYLKYVAVRLSAVTGLK